MPLHWFWQVGFANTLRIGLITWSRLINSSIVTVCRMENEWEKTSIGRAQYRMEGMPLVSGTAKSRTITTAMAREAGKQLGTLHKLFEKDPKRLVSDTVEGTLLQTITQPAT